MGIRPIFPLVLIIALKKMKMFLQSQPSRVEDTGAFHNVFFL